MSLRNDSLTGLMVDEAGVPLLNQLSEEGFIDCVFKMENIKQVDDFIHFEMRAIFEEDIVGFKAQVYRGIDAGLTVDSDGTTVIREGGVYRPAVKFLTLGTQSDNFLSAYLSLCEGTSDKPLVFVEEFPFTGIALHQDSIDILTEPVRIKLFGNDFEEHDPRLYFESFFNIDMPNGYVHWDEKDTDYRLPLLTSLSL